MFLRTELYYCNLSGKQYNFRMTFDERKLRAFLAVVDCRSLGRAALAANMTQPTLSRLIQDMETRLGLPLFERHTKGMALTPAGEAFVPHARLLLFEMEQAACSIDALKGLRRGTVRIGAVAAVTRSIIPRAAAKLLKEAPGLRIDMVEATDSELVDALAGRRIDLMIAAEIPPHDDILPVAECRFDDVYSVFCTVDHPIAAATDIDLDRVLQERWVMPKPGNTPRSLFENLIRRAGRALPVIAIETGSVGAQISFVAQSMLLGWLPQPLIASDLKSGAVALLAIEELTIQRRFFLYRRRGGLLPEAAQHLMRLLPLAELEA